MPTSSRPITNVATITNAVAVPSPKANRRIPRPTVTVTIHAGPTYSRTHWETPPEVVAEELLLAAGQWFDRDAVQHWQLHRWRYSQPIEPFPAPFLRVDQPAPLLFAGDAFGQPRVEGAFLSGYAAANALLGPGPTE